MSSAKSSGKRYFWWRLRNDFFTQITIKKLRRSDNGDKKAIIYLQMILMTIHQDGYLRYDGIEDDISEEIALYLNEPVEVIQDTIKALKEMNLIEIVEDDFFLPEAQKGIGSECSSAERMRRKRARDKEASQSDNDVTQQLHESDAQVTQSLHTCDVEKSREENRKKEIETDKEKEREEEKSYSIPISDSSRKPLNDPDIIVQRFNEICTSFKPVNDMLKFSSSLSNAVCSDYTLNDYEEAFKKAEASDYLKGLTENKTYPSDFGWILEHLEEILHGKYDTFKKNVPDEDEEWYTADELWGRKENSQ